MHVGGRVWRLLGFAVVCVLLLAAPAAAQFDRGTISGVVKDQSGGVVPGATVTATSLQTREMRDGRHGPERVLHADHAQARALRRERRTGRLQEGGPLGRRARRGRRHRRGLHARAGQHLRDGDGRGGEHADADGRDAPEDRRGQGHRAALVLGPQSAGRGRHQAGRDRRQLQQPGVRGLQQRRLQHEREPRGREHDRGGRGDCHPHAVGRHDHRRPERGRDPGGPGPHGQLPARVRPGERRADPLHHQERQQPLHGQRVVLLPRRQAAGQHLGAQPQHERRPRTAGRRRSTTSSTATPWAGRSRASGSRTSCSSSAPRSGWTTSRSRPTPSRCRPRR